MKRHVPKGEGVVCFEGRKKGLTMRGDDLMGHNEDDGDLQRDR